jgi:hypothetical protein
MVLQRRSEKDKSWHKTFDTKYHRIVNYTSTTSDLGIMSRDGIFSSVNRNGIWVSDKQVLSDQISFVHWICSASRYLEAEEMCQAFMLCFD